MRFVISEPVETSEKYISDKIKVLSLLAIILVLYIHSGFHEIANEIKGMQANIILQHMISSVLGNCAVPLFFMISGYLFFRNALSIEDVYKKMKKRVRTLVVPFFFAALFVPIFLIIIEAIPFAEKYMNGGGTLEQMMNWNLIENISALYYKVPNSTFPWAFQLWFLRDLIIIIASAPCLFCIRNLLINRMLLGGVILVLISFVNLPVYPVKSMFWFMCGAIFLSDSKKIGWEIPLILYFVYCCFVFFKPESCINEVEHLARIVGAILLWNVYNAIVPLSFSLKNHKRLLLASSFTFFIYLYHEPTLNVIRKLLVIPFGHTSIGFLISYLLSPWLFVLLTIILGMLLRKYCTRFYSILVGGR